jgi:phosphate/sulfate permease
MHSEVLLGVIGAGAAARLSAVGCGLAGNIAIAWALTLPAAAAIGAGAYYLQQNRSGRQGMKRLAT